MWNQIFVVQVPVLEKIVRTVLVYATIALLFRLTGKRGLANLNTLDFVVIFLLSNVVQNAVIGNDTSFSGGAIGAVTLVALNAAVHRLVARSPRAARILEGTSTTVSGAENASNPRCDGWRFARRSSSMRSGSRTVMR